MHTVGGLHHNLTILIQFIDIHIVGILKVNFQDKVEKNPSLYEQNRKWSQIHGLIDNHLVNERFHQYIII